MTYKLNDFHYNVPDQDLINDIKIVSAKLGKTVLTSREYDEAGKYNSGTIHRRLGSWNMALEKAGLEAALNQNISDKELFENIEKVWIRLGRQPSRREMRQPLSKYSVYPYGRRFGTWRKGLIAFIEFINSNVYDNLEMQTVKPEEIASEIIQDNEPVLRHKTKRIPSERLKVQVLMRDGNICRLCGITVTGENIHFDHIQPWSKGGETLLENLQVLCETHNLAKGDLEYENKSNFSPGCF